ncbi:hypothetical protein QFC21_000456 [Naganishia friedmannii]|uniref:Uncharacterized protein n=1 Tax=Naganishia friedmannii TaxID=89922 RepID=A0ACC2WCN1_9TREE|nr:hypothetical protein QFC21_000456 [Naganishia friedmannii]
MESTIAVTPATEKPTQSPSVKTPMKTAWQTDIRSPSPASSDGGGNVAAGSDDAGNGNETGWKKDRLWFELDLSSREDFAKVQINPFTIAAKNKRRRTQPPLPNGAVPLNAAGKAKQEPRITINHHGTSTGNSSSPEKTTSFNPVPLPPIASSIHQPKHPQKMATQLFKSTKPQKSEPIQQGKNNNKPAKSKSKPNRRLQSPVYEPAHFSQPPTMDYTRPAAYASEHPTITLPASSTSDPRFAVGNHRQASDVSQFTHQDHDRPFWAYQSPPPQTARSPVPAGTYSGVQSSSSRISLQPPMRYAPDARSDRGREADKYSGHSHGPVVPQTFVSRYAQSMFPPSRQSNGSSPYFVDHAPQPRLGSIAAYRNSSGKGLTASTHLDRNTDLAVRDEEWSTMSAKRKRGDNKETLSSSSTHSQPFRLPDKFFDSSASTLTKRKTHAAPSYRSNDSATEVVVVPLHRAKITLFQPSPPKLSAFD